MKIIRSKLFFWTVFTALFIGVTIFSIFLIRESKKISPMRVDCLSYAPSMGFVEKFGFKISEKSIERDLAQISTVTSCIRVYKAGEEHENIPKLAGKYNLKVIQGVWFDTYKDGTGEEKNIKEVKALRRMVADPESVKNITTIVAGNEVMFFERMSDSLLFTYIEEIKTFTDLPIAIADIPESYRSKKYKLSSSLVDIIGVHIFPYWQGTTPEDSSQKILDEFKPVQKLFPNKQVLLYETGWPARGLPQYDALPSSKNQEIVLIDIVNNLSLSYPINIIEAFDQPKKINTVGDEGLTGSHWGLWDIWGIPKANRVSLYLYIAVAYGLLISFLFNHIYNIHLFKSKSETVLWVYSLSIIILFSVSVAYLFLEYVILVSGGQLLFVLQSMMTVAILWNIKTHVKAINTSNNPVNFSNQISENEKSFISIHIPCAGEDPSVLKQTIDACLELNYPNYEILVGINNSPDNLYLEMIKNYSNTPVKFFNLGIIKGAKSGALNRLLKETNVLSQHVALIDSDYVVDREWLTLSMQALDSDESRLTKVVMARQNYRETNSNLAEAANFEQLLCFSFNQVSRNANNSVLLNGTMCVIDKKTLLEVGGWPEKNICEDAEVGMRIQMRGFKVLFLDLFLGSGLAPADFKSLARQHARWAHGSVYNLKILLKTYFFNDDTKLTNKIVIDYFMSWFPWLLQSFLILFFIGGMFGTYFMYYQFAYFVAPSMLIFPFLSLFLSLICSIVLYSKVLGHSVKKIVNSLIVFTALSPYIADGVLSGIFGFKRPFTVTIKGSVIKSTKSPVGKRNYIKQILEILDQISVLSIIFITVAIIEIFLMISKYGFTYIHIWVWIGFLITITLPSLAEVYVLYKENKNRHTI